MSSHRYWKAIVYAQDTPLQVELTQFYLMDGTTRTDASATLTSLITPDSGSVTNLQDSSLTTGALWTGDFVTLKWDAGSAIEVNNFQLGSGALASRFPISVSLFWSDDDVSYFTARQGDYLKWPGPNTQTKNTTAQVWVRTVGQDIAANGSGGIFNPTVPAINCEIGDLLVTNLVRIGSGTTVPSGWTLVASAGPAGNASSDYCEVYTKPVLTEADRTATHAWTNLRGIQMIALSGGIRGVAVESTATAFTGATNVLPVNLPTLTAAGDGRLAYASFFWSLAFGASANTFTFIVPPSVSTWRRISNPLNDCRLGLGVVSLNSGNPNTGQWSTNASGTGGSSCSVSIIFTSAVQIETGLTTPREANSFGLIPPVQPTIYPGTVVSKQQLLMGKTNKNYYMRTNGIGIGRVNGRTMHAENPNVPVGPRRVRLHRKVDGVCVGETWSDPITGVYTFDYVDETDIYYVVAFDHTKLNEAVIADNRVASIIPGAY